MLAGLHQRHSLRVNLCVSALRAAGHSHRTKDYSSMSTWVITKGRSIASWENRKTWLRLIFAIAFSPKMQKRHNHL